MNDFNEDTELIDRYLQGQLSEVEKKLLDDRLKTDEDFKRELIEAQIVKDIVLAAERKNILDKIIAAQASSIQKNKQRFLSFTPQVWAAAASVIFALSIGLYYFIQSNKYEKVFDAYYQPYDELAFPVSRGASEEEMTLASATELYHQKRYQESINQIADVVKKDESLYFLIGLDYLGLKQYNKANDAFTNVSDEFLKADELHWYKALTLTALKKNEEVKVELEKIRSSNFQKQNLIRDLP